MSVFLLESDEGFHTLTSSHAASFRIFSPISLKPFRASSSRSDTLSRTRSVSRLVPSKLICCERRAIEDVRPKSWTERFSANLSNSLSGAVSGSSRYCGGCASSADRLLKDMSEGFGGQWVIYQPEAQVTLIIKCLQVWS